jgi:NADPH2:quinone reductase
MNEEIKPAKTMRAARVQRPGAAEFRIEDVPTPTPGPGQVLIRVESAAVNFSDVLRRRGDMYPFETEFPFVPGGEVAGTIVAHGPGVEGPKVGTRVFALAGSTGFGGYAQYALSYAPTAIPVPPGLDLDVASVLTIAGSTAKLMLTQAARLQPGESVLIPAATGGVGSFAVSIARNLGAGKIIAAVGSPAKFDAARKLGAHDVVDYSAPDWASKVVALNNGKGVDVAFEASGGETLEQTLGALGSFGRLIVFGAASGRPGKLSEAAQNRWLYAPSLNQVISSFNLGEWFMGRPEVAGPALGELMKEVLAEKIRLPVIRTMPLDKVQEAHELIEQRRVSGKLILKPWA